MHKDERKQTDLIFHENEVKTNRLAVIAGVIMSITVSIFSIGGLTNQIQMGENWACIVLLVSSTYELILCLSIRCGKYDKYWAKYVLIYTMVLCSAVTFFIYPHAATFLVYGPVTISIMYCDKYFVRRVSVVSSVAFLLTVTANLVLERISPVVRALHDIGHIDYWDEPLLILLYFMIPRVINFVVISFCGDMITRNGKLMILKRIEASTLAAETTAQLQAAADIQMKTMPKSEFTAPNGCVAVSALVKPAKETGGDFFDYFMLGENLLVVLAADVSDKGLASAMYVMKAQCIIKQALYAQQKNDDTEWDCIDLEAAMNQVNNFITRGNQDDVFVTMWLGCFDCRTGVGKYVNAGHLPPAILDRNGKIRWLENDSQLFMGVFENTDLKAEPIRLKQGDRLVVYTDGVTDARNAGDVSFGRDGLLRALQRIADAEQKTAHFTTVNLMNFLEQHIGSEEQFDDITIVTLGFSGDYAPVRQTVCVDSDRNAPEKIMDVVNDILLDSGCPNDARRDIDVIIDDVCSNIVDYAYENTVGTVRVSAECGLNYINLEFRDCGAAFNPLEYEEPVFSEAPNYGGLGIYLVKKIADKMEYRYENNENILTLTKVWNI
ncbi:MAG TPA: hypothetical protein DDY98_09180 [Ruminococcaceae bacterium]|nr:hypothetical protein [Oscillospiraceae bacterium]